jgi:hypothetical protein
MRAYPIRHVVEHHPTGDSLSFAQVRSSQIQSGKGCGHFVHPGGLLPLPSVIALARLEAGRQDAAGLIQSSPMVF